MAASWTVVVRQRAIQAQGGCVNARGRLTNAMVFLACPMHIVDAQGREAGTRIVLLRGIFANVCSDLSVVRSATKAAELLACRGGATYPTAPLPSIEHLPDDYHYVQLSLGLLQSARICARHACDSVERCWGRLSAVDNLLANPGLPGVDGFVEAERVAAHEHLEAALDLAEVSFEIANTAVSLLER